MGKCPRTVGKIYVTVRFTVLVDTTVYVYDSPLSSSCSLTGLGKSPILLFLK